MLRAPIPKLNALNHLLWLLSKAPCIILPTPLNITLIPIDNNVSGIAATRLGNITAIIANIIARVPSPIFVRGVVFLLRPFAFIVVVDVGKDEYNFNNITPVATLSIPIANNIIESSRIMLPAAIRGNPTVIKRVDNMRQIAPLPI